MSLATFFGAICIISSHGGSADHLSTFTKELSKGDQTHLNPIEIYASGPALKKFQEKGVEVKFPFSLDHLSAEEEGALAAEIAKTCATASVIITDVGSPFEIKVHEILAKIANHIPRYAYYDNPESYVPGGYSETAAKVMLSAHGILFANSNLANSPLFNEPGKEIDFGTRKKIGIGYYPVQQAEKIGNRREKEQQDLRQKVFAKHGLIDNAQKVLVYFGGNNEEYFTKAFPAFLEFIKEGMDQTEFNNFVFILQQHPAAKSKNIDGKMISSWMEDNSQKLKDLKMIISDFSSDDAQVLADAALYYQTSMGPQFLLAGIPAIQVGHDTYKDILVQNHLSPSVTNTTQFINAINDLSSKKKEIPKDVIFKGLGIKSNWLSALKKVITGLNELASP